MKKNFLTENKKSPDLENQIKKFEKEINKKVQKLFKENNLKYNNNLKFKVKNINNIDNEYIIFLNSIINNFFKTNVNTDKGNKRDKIKINKYKNNEEKKYFRDNKKIFFLLIIYSLFLLLYIFILNIYKYIK